MNKNNKSKRKEDRVGRVVRVIRLGMGTSSPTLTCSHFIEHNAKLKV